jgi:hypothetical protein
MEHAEHPSRDLLERFMEARVSREEVRQVVRHLLTGCAACSKVITPLWRRALGGIEEGGMEKSAMDELGGIAEALGALRRDLEALRARLPESGEAHAVIGCCLLDRFDPLIADLRSLL